MPGRCFYVGADGRCIVQSDLPGAQFARQFGPSANRKQRQKTMKGTEAFSTLEGICQAFIDWDVDKSTRPIQKIGEDFSKARASR